jgi:GNAT superfamily N-acetyltransferase
MWFRQTQREHEANKGEANRRAMRDLVAAGRTPGILAIHDGQAVGWCSVAPRTEFPRLARSRILRPIDDQPVWSVVCLFVARRFRGHGVSVRLLEAAAAFVRSRGGDIVEGYAVEPRKEVIPDLYGYHGLAAAYRAAGYVEVARRSATRPIMRRLVAGGR